MKTTIIKLNEGQFMEDVLEAIPSNSINFKVIPGIHATTLELNAKRNSIILEPNVPVIMGKKTKGFFGIFEGVYIDDVIQYMQNKRHVYKKIMVTPESFFKGKRPTAPSRLG